MGHQRDACRFQRSGHLNRIWQVQFERTAQASSANACCCRHPPSALGRMLAVQSTGDPFAPRSYTKVRFGPSPAARRGGRLPSSHSPAPAPTHGLPGWEELSHSGLLLDAARVAELARHAPSPLDDFAEAGLRRRATAILNGEAESADVSRFVAFVLEEVCGFDAGTGTWQRGSNVPADWGRRIVTGETAKPRHLWQGPRGATLPMFFDDAARFGIGRSRRTVSQALGWLRAGREQLPRA